MIAVLFLITHTALFVHGLVQPESFLSGDRADTRLGTIEFVFSGKPLKNTPSGIESASEQSVFDRVLASGHPGDYVIQGVFLSLFNQHLLVALQVALSFAGVLCLFKLTNLLSRSTKLSALATAIYLLLPGSLIQPHQLVSEALFNPLVAISAYLLVCSIENDFHRKTFLYGLLALSIAVFIRPQLMLFPFVLAAILTIWNAQHWRFILVTVIPVSFLLVGAWTALVIGVEGEPSIGGKDRSVGIAFYKTVERMAVAGEFELDADAYPDKSMPTSDFLKIIADNPVIYIRQRITGTINYVANPGTYSLAAHHLQILDGQGDTTYWGEMRDRSGIAGTISQILARGPLFVILILGSAVIWGLVLLVAFAGLFPFIKDRNVSSAAKAILIGLVVYQTGIVMALSVYGRWQQRTPIDFVIVILLVFGVQLMAKRITGKNVATSD